MQHNVLIIAKPKFMLIEQKQQKKINKKSNKQQTEPSDVKIDRIVKTI